MLFLDEVHRFNKAQQDAFLPWVEDGTLVFIGATTENPSFELNNALLSRARVYVLRALTEEDLRKVLERALWSSSAAVARRSRSEEQALELIARAADGDARRALNMLELSFDLAGVAEPPRITEAIAAEVATGGLRRFDKQGEAFYDQISALHKSVRGSDPDAALYWLCRMLDGGCDPRYIARRVLRMASEDIGNADPRGLTMALEACEVYERLGTPEGELAIAQAVVFLACAAKSNAVYAAFGEAMEDAKKLGSLDVPLHLRNAPTRLMKELGYGKDYRYAHNEPDAYAAGESYFPGRHAGAAVLPPGAARPRDQDRRGAGEAERSRIAPLTDTSLSPMLDPKLLRSDPAAVAANLARRGFTLDVARLGALEESRKKWQIRADELRNERNVHAKSVGKAKAQGQDIAPLLKQTETLGAQLTEAEAELAKVQAELDELVLGLPNLLHESVPDGRDETANVELRRWGEPRRFDFKPRDHVELGEKLKMMDFAAAGKISGARFTVLTGALARLQRALIQFMLDLHTGEHGYRETYVPYLVNAQSLTGTGQLPKFEADLFAVQRRVRPVSDSDRGSAGHEPGARLDRRGGRAAAALRRAHAVLPLGGGLVRQGHARHDPPASVREGRAGAHRAAAGFVRRARGAHAQCRGSAEAAGAAVSRRRAVRRRRRLRFGEDLRPGSLAAGAERLSRDFLVLELRGVPGAPHAGALAQSGDRQAGAAAHAERLRRRGGPRSGRGDGEQSAGGRQHRRAGSRCAATWPGSRSSSPAVARRSHFSATSQSSPDATPSRCSRLRNML